MLGPSASIYKRAAVATPVGLAIAVTRRLAGVADHERHRDLAADNRASDLQMENGTKYKYTSLHKSGGVKQIQR